MCSTYTFVANTVCSAVPSKTPAVLQHIVSMQRAMQLTMAAAYMSLEPWEQAVITTNQALSNARGNTVGHQYVTADDQLLTHLSYAYCNMAK